MVRASMWVLNLISISCIFMACKLTDNSIKGSAGSSANSPQFSVEIDVTDPSGTTPYLGKVGFSAVVTNNSNFIFSSISINSSDSSVEQISGCSMSIGPTESCTLVLEYTSQGSGTNTADVTATFTNPEGTNYTKEFSVSAEGSYPGIATVNKVYPLNGNNWNDYIAKSNMAADEMHQADVACDGNTPPTEINACFNGAEKMYVETGKSSCDNLSIVEDLDAFYWWCFVENGKAVFYSGGLRHEKGLNDLLDETGWFDNRVRVYEGSTEILTSSLSEWWTNNILALPTQTTGATTTVGNGGDTSGRIYYLQSSAATDELEIIDPKISIVVKPTQVLSFDGDGNAGFYDGIITSMANFLWIEGEYEGNVFGDTVLNLDGRFGQARNYKATGAGGGSVCFVNFTGADAWRIVNSTLFQCGIQHYGSASPDRQIYYHVKVVNSDSSGFDSASGTKNFPVFSNMLLANSALDGMDTDRHRGITMSNVTAVNNASIGVELRLNDYQTVRSLLVTNNNTGFASDRQNLSTFVNIAALNNTIYGVDSDNNNVGYTRFEGNLVVGNNGIEDCYNAFNEPGGIIHQDCNLGSVDNSNNYGPTQESTAFLRKNKSIVGSFVGKVTVDSNPGHTLGVLAFGSITDFFNFDNIFRAWGVSNAAGFPDNAFKGDCSAGNCQIWDWALSSADTTLLNRSVTQIAVNPAFVDGATCPSQLDPNILGNLSTDQKLTPNTFLIHAEEILLDGLGDDDSLCESNEACIYNPNYGFYQGHGDFRTQSCTFVDGPSISNVKMFAYPNNGY